MPADLGNLDVFGLYGPTYSHLLPPEWSFKIRPAWESEGDEFMRDVYSRGLTTDESVGFLAMQRAARAASRRRLVGYHLANICSVLEDAYGAELMSAQRQVQGAIQERERQTAEGTSHALSATGGQEGPDPQELQQALEEAAALLRDRYTRLVARCNIALSQAVKGMLEEAVAAYAACVSYWSSLSNMQPLFSAVVTRKDATGTELVLSPAPEMFVDQASTGSPVGSIGGTAGPSSSFSACRWSK